MKQVIVLGSINMDLSIECDRFPVPGETIHGHDMTINLGGKGANQAVACAKMGTKPFLIGSIGQDIYGQLGMRALCNHQVDTKMILVDDNQPTGIAMITRCQGENQIILSGGANLMLSIDSVAKKLSIARKGDLFLTQFENDYQVVVEAIQLAKAKSMYTIFNPAPANLIPNALYPSIDLLIVNQSEAQLLSSQSVATRDDATKAISNLQKKGAKDVIVTLGKAGSVASIGGELYFTPALNVNAIDSTAAGDAFIGTICHGLAQGLAIQSILTMATTVSAMTVTKIGALDSIPTFKEYQDFIKNN